jgi:REP element-mobilizing transposase RayT
MERMVGTRHAVSLREQFGKPVIGSVTTIVRSFKSDTTKRIQEIRNTPTLPVWQSRFYEYIVHNEKDLNNIRDYIINNPLEWQEDLENPSHCTR